MPEGLFLHLMSAHGPVMTQFEKKFHPKVQTCMAAGRETLRMQGLSDFANFAALRETRLKQQRWPIVLPETR